MQVFDLLRVWGAQPHALPGGGSIRQRTSEERARAAGEITRTFRTIPTIRTIRTRLRQAAPWQATRTTRNSARGQGKLYCSRRGVDGFPRTFPCRSTVPPVLRQFCPASFPPLSESSEKSEGSELSSRPLHRPTGSSVLHPSSLHRSAVTLAVPQHTKKCDSIFTRCRGFSPARGLGRAAPCSSRRRIHR